MNAGYGKLIQKPIETHTTWTNKKAKSFNEVNRANYQLENFEIITSLKETEIFLGTEKIQPTGNHKKFLHHVGSMVLSQSKIQMNKAMAIIDEGCYYTDTDSSLVAKEFLELLPPEIMGSKLGQFHPDFDISTFKNKTAEAYSDYTIILAPKTYMCIVQNDFGDICVHYRMKGVSKRGVEEQITRLQDELKIDRITAFKHLYLTMMFEKVTFNNNAGHGFKGRHTSPVNIIDVEDMLKKVGAVISHPLSKYQSQGLGLTDATIKLMNKIDRLKQRSASN